MLGDVIPQVFHDILARVMPGATVLLLALVCWFGPVEAFEFTDANRDWLFGFGPLCIATLTSYMFALLLKETWSETVGRWAKGMYDRLEENEKGKAFRNHMHAVGDNDPPCNQANTLPCVYVMLDHIRQMESSTEGARLLKFASERAMCQVMVTGMLVCIVINGAKAVYADTWAVARIVSAVLLAVTLVAFWLRERRLWELFVFGTVTVWLAHRTGMTTIFRLPTSEKKG